MRILNIGLDKTLVGGKGSGDAVARHREYGTYVESLDIIVYTARYEQLPVFKISEKVTGYPTNSRNRIFFLFDAARIASKLYQTHRFDIIVAQEPYGAGLVGWWLKRNFPRVKLQVNLHGDFWNNPRWAAERWYHRFLQPIVRFVVWRADAIRVMSGGQKDKLLAAGLPPHLIRVISTPVDIERFKNFETHCSPNQKKLLATLRQQTEAGGRKTILWVGREDQAKDLPTLYAAIRFIKDRKERRHVRFWMVGMDRIPNDLVDIITARRGVESADLPAYYHASYLTVLSSSSESFGKVLVEANASGKPVVATATTGALEIIQDGYNGFLVPIGDGQALAEKILYLLDHPTVAQEMGQNGQRLVQEKYGSNTQKIIQLWKDIEVI